MRGVVSRILCLQRIAQLKVVSQFIAADPTQDRRKPGAQPGKSVLPIEAVDRPQPSGSYSAGPNTRLPGKFVEQNHLATHSYLHTASLEADGGELIGIDTYA